jgi:hypothetical protein
VRIISEAPASELGPNEERGGVTAWLVLQTAFETPMFFIQPVEREEPADPVLVGPTATAPIDHSAWSAQGRFVENAVWFVPDCQVWIRDFTTSVETLRPGEELHCGTAVARIKSVKKLQARVRNLVTITYASDDLLHEALTLTDDHVLQVRRGISGVRPVRAADIDPGDFVQVPGPQREEATVVSVDSFSENMALVEVAFEEEDQFACVSMRGSALPVEVYCIRAIHTVKILQFKRYEAFRELFFDSEELAPCRDALSAAGLSMDLSQFDLGQGKLVVRDVQLARRAMTAIHLRLINGKVLRKSDVVVSADMERTVRLLVMKNPATLRKNQHVRNEPGELIDLGHL